MSSMWGSLMVQLSAMGLSGAVSQAHQYAVEWDRREREERQKAEAARREQERARIQAIERSRKDEEARRIAWAGATKTHPPGKVVTGEACQVLDFGAVVEFDNLMGVILISRVG